MKIPAITILTHAQVSWRYWVSPVLGVTADPGCIEVMVAFGPWSAGISVSWE